MPLKPLDAASLEMFFRNTAEIICKKKELLLIEKNKINITRHRCGKFWLTVSLLLVDHKNDNFAKTNDTHRILQKILTFL